MKIFKKITDWPHVDWDDWSSLSEKHRNRLKKLRDDATTATKHDLQKPVQHLLRDVHESLLYPWPHPSKEEADRADDGIRGPYEDMPIQYHRLIVELGRLQGAQKATAALLAITAFEGKRASWWIIALTWMIAFLTLALVFFEARHFLESPPRERTNVEATRFIEENPERHAEASKPK